jgi:Flp pilus assembly protein TadG
MTGDSTMTTRTVRRTGRRGVTLVETALVLSIALFLLFSVYEYGRYVMMQQLMENAAREGARYAVVHTADKTTADVQNQVTTYLCGLQGQIQNYQVSVTGLALQTGPVYTQGTPFSNWTQASPTDGVVVTITGQYTPQLPSLQMLPNVVLPVFGFSSYSVTLQTQAVMYSEGN